MSGASGSSKPAVPYSLISAATTNATSVKASAGVVTSITASNINASPAYLKFFNKASAPTVGSDTPVLRLTIPGNTSGAGFSFPIPEGGLGFATGIAFCLTTGITDASTAAVAVSEVLVNIAYK